MFEFFFPPLFDHPVVIQQGLPLMLPNRIENVLQSTIAV